MYWTATNEIIGKLECVEETNMPAYQELQQKCRNPKYQFTSPAVTQTLRSYGLLDQNENVPENVQKMVLR